MFLCICCTIIILVAFGVEALFGFGGGLVAVPLLSLVIDVRDAVALVSVLQFLLDANVGVARVQREKSSPGTERNVSNASIS